MVGCDQGIMMHVCWRSSSRRGNIPERIGMTTSITARFQLLAILHLNPSISMRAYDTGLERMTLLIRLTPCLAFSFHFHFHLLLSLLLTSRAEL